MILSFYHECDLAFPIDYREAGWAPAEALMLVNHLPEF
jgi:hypothetical protein